jgi:hypothetical protein
MMSDPTDPENPQPAQEAKPIGESATGQVRNHAGRLAKSWLGKLWSTGGGGFYGLGYLINFVWLEVQLLTSEVAEAEGVFDFVSSQLIERITRFAIDSITNSIKAFLWPVKFISAYELWGIGILVVGSVLYTKLFHQAIVNFLGIDPEAEKKQKKTDKKAAKKKDAERG